MGMAASTPTTSLNGVKAGTTENAEGSLVASGFVGHGFRDSEELSSSKRRWREGGESVSSNRFGDLVEVFSYGQGEHQMEA